jgi:endonuclease III
VEKILIASSIHERKLRAQKIIALLEEATKNMRPPLTNQIVDLYGRDPYLILISCLLSLRARDTSTIHVCERLFAQVKTPAAMVALSLDQIEHLIYPVNFYRRKAAVLKSVSLVLLEQFNGKVPSDKKALLSISGIGPKTAALVLGHAFGIPAICVDIHVHRISNRLGLIQTTRTIDTERELELVIPQDKWIVYNYLLVTWGQNVCVPVSPLCNSCVLLPICPQVGVIRHR